VGETHETLVSQASLAPAGNGSASGLHDDPFQVSTSGYEDAAEFIYEPTTTQVEEGKHDTPRRSMDRAPVGFGGIGSAAQMVPFQTCTRGDPPRVNEAGKVAVYWPTAKHVVELGHDTALSKLGTAPLGLGGF
jgi:hypothetical protein